MVLKANLISFHFLIIPTYKEKEVLKKNTQDSSLSTIIAKNKMDITQNFTSYQKSILQKMKSITNASQERCASILMKTNFKLNESIEAYYRGGP